MTCSCVLSCADKKCGTKCLQVLPGPAASPPRSTLSFLSARFFRELTELKTFANYSTCDRSNLADWLGGIDPKFRQYTYNLLTCGINRNFLHRVTEQQLQEDCHINTGFHRVRILTAARGAGPAAACCARAGGWGQVLRVVRHELLGIFNLWLLFVLPRNASLPYNAANCLGWDRCIYQLPEEHRVTAGQVSPAGNNAVLGCSPEQRLVIIQS